MKQRIIPIAVAKSIAGSCTQTSKMPCKSYSLPTLACKTGFKMAQIKGSICSKCYANTGFYSMYANTVEPAQHARLDSITDPNWIDAMVSMIGTDSHFRWHDSGDLQDVQHLEKIAQVAINTPNCKHWLPTREYAMVKQYIDLHGSLPSNLIVRLSAMYPDKPVIIPKSLQGFENITTSNVHTKNAPVIGTLCSAPANSGKCGDCRACWSGSVVSYELH